MKRTLVIVGLGLIGGRPHGAGRRAGPRSDFICSDEVNSPGIKVLTRASKRLDALTRGRAAEGPRQLRRRDR